MTQQPKTVLSHYWFFDIRGGEQVVKNIVEALPVSRIYSLCGKQESVRQVAGNMPATWSFLNGLPGVEKYYRNLLPLFPFACKSVHIDPSANILISNESGPAKVFPAHKRTLHICNCLTPMRYLWSHSQEYLDTLRGAPKLLFRALLPSLRKWDLNSSRLVHHFISISNHVAQRVKRFYGRDSEVIYPPVRYGMFSLAPEKGNYYLVMSALVSYKRIDLAIAAFNELKLPLKVAGCGPELENLKKMAGPTIEFLGRVEDRDLPDLYSKAKAFVFPGEEDYGITPLEAQASGTPVIAFRKGGATETVLDGKSGIFFDQQSTADLVQAITRFERNGVSFVAEQIRQSISSFSEAEYQRKFRDFVYSKWAAFANRR